MIIKAVDHITINVKDLEKSRTFYGEVLGLPYLETVDMGNHLLTYYKLTDTTRLELITYQEEMPESCLPSTAKGTYRHFCLVTDDLQKAYDDICAGGGRMISEPSYIDKLGFSGFLFADPNGVEIEVISR